MASSATSELQHLLTIPPAGEALMNQSNSATAIAHAALEAIRNSGDLNFLFLRTILEAGQTKQPDETLLFHCITGCRHVILHNWIHYSDIFCSLVRDFFMHYGNHTCCIHGYSRTIQIACFSTCVSFWKREWDTLLGEERGNRHQKQLEISLQPKEQAVSHLIQEQCGNRPPLQGTNELFLFVERWLQPEGNNFNNRKAAILFMGALVGEFAGKSGVSYRLPIEFHKRAHSLFEKKIGLERALQLSMNALSSVVADFQQHQDHSVDVQSAQDTLQVILDILNWEYGNDAFCDMDTLSGTKSTILRLPQSWKELLIRPDFVQTIFQWYQHTFAVPSSSSQQLTCNLGQLLLALASISGPIFANRDERKEFGTFLLDGTVHLLDTLSPLISKQSISEDEQEILFPIISDTLGLVSRIITNYKLAILVELPKFSSLLQDINIIGTNILLHQVKECEAANGNLDDMIFGDNREEIIVLLLDCITSLCGDPWLLYSGQMEQRLSAQSSIASLWSPLYTALVQGRMHMAGLEERYIVANYNEEDADRVAVEEHVSDVNMKEELISVATLGRLNISNAIACLSSLFQNTVPQLQQSWRDQRQHGQQEVSPEIASLLEQARLLTLYIGHLLTDDCSGETPVMPDAVIMTYQSQSTNGGDNVMAVIESTVGAMLSFAQSQAEMVSVNPSDPRLSPLLAKSFLWFLNRWAPAYIFSQDGNNSNTENPSYLSPWSAEEKAKEAISFCITFCLHFQCCWPQEKEVQESASKLLLSLARRKSRIRSFMVTCPSFRQMVLFHCLTAGLRHSISKNEFKDTIQNKINSLSTKLTLPDNLDMVIGYQRLPYQEKSRILTALLVACSEPNNTDAYGLWKDSVGSVLDTFSSLVHALATSQVNPRDIHVQETACLCVEMFTGIVHSYASSNASATDGSNPNNENSKIPELLTPLLQQLSGLMVYYADDLSICEALLTFFCDYTEQFVIGLDKHQCSELFSAAAILLKHYSINHCDSIQRKHKQQQQKTSHVDNRHTDGLVEEQAYSDILRAMDLLIQLGTKDFMDAFNNSNGVSQANTVESSQVTDVIFYGLQQIMPLMTEGLLQYPTLCSKYFSLVGFMMDTYPEKLYALPQDLFNSIIQSTIFGMKHHDSSVAKYSLSGMASLFKDPSQRNHIQHHATIFEQCTQGLLNDVIFQNLIWDRLEAAGTLLLALVATNPDLFSTIVQGQFLQPLQHSQDQNQCQQAVRLKKAFESLLKPDSINHVTQGGYEGRASRIRFKKDFEFFCQDVHSFLVLK